MSYDESKDVTAKVAADNATVVNAPVDYSRFDGLAPVPETTATVGGEVAVNVESTTPTIAERIRGYLLAARDYLHVHSYEVFLIAIVIAIAAFVLLFPVAALGVGATVAAVSGWVAYLGLRKRTTEGK